MSSTFLSITFCLIVVVRKLQRPVMLLAFFVLTLFSLFDGSIDCGFFMLTNVNSYHDGVLANYSHENILDIRKTWLYSIASSNLFETDFHGLFGYYSCKS